MQGTAKCILCWLRVPSNASRPSESHNSFVVVEWKGTRYEMPRANLQSCWHLIYVCGVCLPRISLIPWLSGLTSPMGLKGMISTGATGTKGRSRHAQLCLSISHLEMIYRAKCTSKRAGVREGSKLWNISAVHHTVSGSFALLSALVWRAGKNLVVKKREIKLTGDQTGDPFGRYLAQIFVEQLLGKVRWQTFVLAGWWAQGRVHGCMYSDGLRMEEECPAASCLLASPLPLESGAQRLSKSQNFKPSLWLTEPQSWK